MQTTVEDQKLKMVSLRGFVETAPAALGDNRRIGCLWPPQRTGEQSVLATEAVLPPLLGGPASREHLAGISEGDTGHPTYSCRILH